MMLNYVTNYLLATLAVGLALMSLVEANFGQLRSCQSRCRAEG